MTNLEGRVLLRRRALDPLAGVRTDLEVLNGLATRLGQPAHRFPSEAEAVFTELREASNGGLADYSGISYDRLLAGESAVLAGAGRRPRRNAADVPRPRTRTAGRGSCR
jgi:assimilatory nitrate reductase catalytic subunit